MLKKDIETVIQQIERLERERDLLPTEDLPVNEILDKTENYDRQIFTLKQQLNETNHNEVCALPSCKNHRRNDGPCRKCKEIPVPTQL